ncbi:MAG: hypothetical protein H9Q65_04840 [Spiroplasma ixodetis]|nr:hypothetical protein [Spiroplasma ixodetis]MBP1527327.1 hypothetical protein [Spiroplasma ixodetis]MBP1528550.1 hypothetical protein [Spiroplasma ixodetis]
MNGLKLGIYIDNFVHLNPKNNKYPNFNKYDLNSFSIIKNQFKENKKYIITSNYDDIFYSKNEFLNGKKWIEIFLSSKDIFEYHKKIRDDFPYCKRKKLNKTLLDDLFFWFDKNPKKIITDVSEMNCDIELRKKLEQIRYFLDEQDWSNYFFNLQKLMHEYIIKFLSWENKNLDYISYSKIFKQKLLINNLSKYLIDDYLQFIQKVNLYRNTLSKSSPKMLDLNQNLITEWNKSNDLSKKIIAKKLYYSLIEFIDDIK